MVVVHKGRHGADLYGVGIIGRVLKQTVVWIKQLARHQEEELSRRATVVQPAFNSSKQTDIQGFVRAVRLSERTQ